MKRRVLAILCLFLAGCGTFDIKVQIVPKASATAPPTVMASLPVLSPTPTREQPTATAPLEPTPTSNALQVGQSIMLTTLHMSDRSHGWGVESTGHIVKTADGGWTWKNVTPLDGGSFDSHGFFAFNNESVWAIQSQVEGGNIVWRTQDGGATWEASQPIALGNGKYSPLALQFPDPRNGWLLLLARDGAQGNYVLLFKSGDGGQSWEPVSNLLESVSQSYLPDTHTTMAFFDGQAGWLGGWWGKDNPNQWMILRTGNGGENWSTDQLALPDKDSINCDGHPILDMPAGTMAVEMTCTDTRDPKYLFHHVYYLSTNTAPTWHSWKIEGEFLSAYFLNPSQGWMMVKSDIPRLNYVEYTQDGGKNWVQLGEVSWRQAEFDFVNGKEGWAVVGNGFATALVHTENGGTLWIEVRPYVIDY